MVDWIDGLFGFLIVRMPGWRSTAFLMRLRHNWYTRHRRWDEQEQKWVRT